MQRLVDKLTKLLDNDKPTLIDFEELTGAYSRKKVDAVDKLLNGLQHAGLLSYIREDYGFRINVTSIDKLLEYKQ